MTVVNAIVIESGGGLTNNALALSIDGSPNIGLLNSGFLINNGIIELGDALNGSSLLPIGIINNATITNGPWDNPANWSPNSVPTVGDDVLIPDLSPNMSPIASTNVIIRSLEVEAGGQLTTGVNTLFNVEGAPTVSIPNNGTIINESFLEVGVILFSS